LNTHNSEKTDYGNWVSTRIILAPLSVGLLFLLLAYWLHTLTIVGLLFLFIAAYFAYARYLFSAQGKNVQAKIQNLLLDHLAWNGIGEVLEIGCGNGAISIQLAKKYPHAVVTGVDTWGGQWEYAKSACEKNARIEGVGERVRFEKASAAKLPFPDGSFNAAVSNLTFHEVADVKDKRELLRESLRVVRQGGSFAFQDLFLNESEFGKIDDFLHEIQGWGIHSVTFMETRKAPFIPATLKLPFMVGTIGIIVGEK
jgi:SAM-dependent methyltransferase